MDTSSRVAVLGATGQLGSDLAKSARELGHDVVALGHEHADVTDAAAVRKAIEDARPAIVVNTVAFHNVDACEGEPEKALRVNALGALHVARAADALGARIVYVSTDYV